MKRFIIGSVALIFTFFVSTVWAADADLLKPPEAPGSATPAGVVNSPASSSTPASQNDKAADVSKFYTGLFDIMLWVGAILVGGLGSFGLFLFLHKRATIKGDWLWPLIPALFAGYLAVMWPMLLSDRSMFYDQWSYHCFNKETYGGDRDPNSNGRNKLMCVEAQTGRNDADAGGNLSFSALGLNSAFRVYKDYLADGRGNAMYPSEMHFVIWLVTALYGLGIYQLCLFIRRRFYTN